MSKEEKRGHLSAWRASGLTGTAYCKEQGLKYSTFMRWVSVLAEAATPVGHFVELRPKGSELEELRIVLPNGVSVVTRQVLSVKLLKSLADV